MVLVYHGPLTIDPAKANCQPELQVNVLPGGLCPRTTHHGRDKRDLAIASGFISTISKITGSFDGLTTHRRLDALVVTAHEFVIQ